MHRIFSRVSLIKCRNLFKAGLLFALFVSPVNSACSRQNSIKSGKKGQTQALDPSDEFNIAGGTDPQVARRVSNRNEAFLSTFDNKSIVNISPNGRLAMLLQRNNLVFAAVKTPNVSIANSGKVSFDVGSLLNLEPGSVKPLGFVPAETYEVDPEALNKLPIFKIPHQTGGNLVEHSFNTVRLFPQGAIAHDPRFGEHPFRVNDASQCSEVNFGQTWQYHTGRYECYRLIVYMATNYESATLTRGVINPDLPDAVAANPVTVFRLISSQIAIAVDAFEPGNSVRKTAAQVAFAQVISPFRLVRGDSNTTPGTKDLFSGMEVTSTADGRLIVWKEIETSNHELDVKARAPSNPDPTNTNLLYSFTETPWLPGTFDRSKRIPQIHAQNARLVCRRVRNNEGICPVAEESFGRVYPLAAKSFDGTNALNQPFKSAFAWPDGKAVSQFGPGYNWISPDGADLVAHSGETGLFIVGQSTRNVLKFFDSSISVTRSGFKSDRDRLRIHQIMSLGTAGGLWNAFPEQADNILPLNKRRPLQQFLIEDHTFIKPWVRGEPNGPDLVGKPYVYTEVAGDDFLDPNFLLYLHMNERKLHPDDGDVDITQTPDTSGNFHVAKLEQEALFPYEADMPSGGYPTMGSEKGPAHGFLGKAIYFTQPGSRVVVTASNRSMKDENETFAVAHQKMTVELAFRKLGALNQAGQVNIAELPGIAKVVYASGKIKAQIFIGNESHVIESTSLPSGQGPWVHIGLRMRGRTPLRNGRADLLLNGEQVASTTWTTAGKFKTVGNEVAILGPNGACTGCASGRIMMIDEFAVSKVWRDDEYMAIAAFADFRSPFFGKRLGAYSLAKNLSHGRLPAGLEASDVRVPRQLLKYIDGTSASSIIELGKKLFEDTVLSVDASGVDQGISCASCHMPGKSFTDGRKLAVKAGGGELTLNTPTTLNRAFSMAQFFNLRADDLIEQALKPIINPDEMGGNLVRIVGRLKARPGYVRLFQDAFGPHTNGNALPSADGIAVALSIYELTQLSGNSPVDFLQLGQNIEDSVIDSATKNSIARGMKLFESKGRCTACHDGSNYSDERMHKNLGQLIKTPTLRNIASTGPYMHDGRFNTLEQVIDFYNEGGIAGQTFDQEMRPLGLSEGEKADLVNFMHGLSGNSFPGPKPDERMKTGNNGTVTCTAYCSDSTKKGWSGVCQSMFDTQERVFGGCNTSKPNGNLVCYCKVQ